MDGMQFSRNSTHPTQSNVKVHSMSTLTGPHDQKIGFKKRPPLCYTLNFGDAGDDEEVEGKVGKINNTGT